MSQYEGFPHAPITLTRLRLRDGHHRFLQNRQTVMVITGSASDWGISPTHDGSIPQKAICFSMEGKMIDALLNVAVFAALALCIVGFSAWAHKRVDAQ